MRISFLLLALFNTYLNAQSALSLKEAIQMALQNNYGIQIAKKEQEIAAIQNNWTAAGAFPKIELNVTPGITSNSVNQKFINNTEINRNNAVQKSINANILLNYNVLNGFKVFVTKDKLETLEKLSQSELELKILDTYFEVATSYYEILNANNNLSSLHAQQSNARVRMELEQKRYELGQQGKNAYLLSAIELQNIQILIASQEQALKESYIALNTLLLKPYDNTYLLTDSLNYEKIKSFKPVRCSLDESVQNRQFEYQHKINALTKKEVRTQRYPSINLSGDYHYNRLDNQAGFNLFNQSYGSSFGLQLNLPLYDGNAVGHQLKALDLESEKSKLEQSDWKTTTEYQYNLYQSKMQHALALYQLQLNKEFLAQENLKIIMEKFNLGESNSLEYSQALYNVISVDLEKNNSLNNYINAFINAHYLCSSLDEILQSN